MSKIEVNQISSQCGSTLTIGQSGDTIQLACGATQTGFGRTGTVDWDTTAKTASFTAVSGNGYFVNTTSGAITLTLPASPSAGDIVAFKDYAFTFATNNLTVDGNGSPIGGVDGTQGPKYSTNGTSKTFIYVDGTKGWLATNESTDTSQESSPTFIVATGGTVTCCGDYKIHTFTSPGTFTVCSVGNPEGSNSVDYLVVAGGGGGGAGGTAGFGRGGGGAGGYREGYNPGSYTASPLATTSLPVSATGYPITVGGGGSGGPDSPSSTNGTSGSNSIFSTITSAGGGGGAGSTAGSIAGGSGGGETDNPYASFTAVNGAAGNTPPVSPPQGNPGGANNCGPRDCTAAGGGGGGATAAGGNAGANPPHRGGPGGTGATTSITGSPTAYAGGGGGGGQSSPNTPALGGTGGGGNGGGYNSPTGYAGAAGTTNTGGGGGGGGYYGPGSVTNSTGGAGGSGIVIIRYKYQ